VEVRSIRHRRGERLRPLLAKASEGFSLSECQLLADAVEKVGATLTTRNNRIAQAGFLNRSCAFAARLESILLEDPLKIFFRRYRPIVEVLL
jgi:hypothetical protein